MLSLPRKRAIARMGVGRRRAGALPMNLLASLRYLVALHEHKHFGRAAQACHITQPALSNALRALEEEFDTAIVRRGRTFEGLTPEGERVLLAARRMLHEQELLAQDLKSAQGRPAGSLVIGAVPTAMPVAARFVASLHARHPGIEPVLRSLSSQEIETGLDTLAIDLGLGYSDRLPSLGHKLNALAQYNEQYFLLRKAPKGHRGAMRLGKPISWTAAAMLPLCLLSPEMHNRAIVDAAFTRAGVQVKPVIETNSMSTLSLSVLTGAVCTILPGAHVGSIRSWAGVEALPIVDPVVSTPIAFMTVPGERTSRTLAAALELARDPDWLAALATHAGAQVL